MADSICPLPGWLPTSECPGSIRPESPAEEKWLVRQAEKTGRERQEVTLCGDRAPFFPWERQFVTNWGCIHPEKQLNANERGTRIKGLVYDKRLEEMSMFGAWSSGYHQWRIIWHCNYRRKRHISNTTPQCSFSSSRPRCVSPILVSSSIHSKTISM